MGAPAQSTTVIFQNYTDTPMVLQSASLAHGIWTDDMMPPGQMPARSSAGPGIAVWESESDGIMTGTEGTAVYLLEDGQNQTTVTVNWDNPYVGGNSYSITPNGPRAQFYRGLYTGGDGNNATVRFGLQNMA